MTAQAAGPDRIARRCLLKAAVFGSPPGSRGLDQEAQAGGAQPGAGRRQAQLTPRAVTGQVLDASPQILVIGTQHGEERFALTADANAWRGEKTDPAAIKVGDQAVVRRHESGRERADRIWANIGRVTGTIVRRDSGALLVDPGDGSGQQVVVIAERTSHRIQVRFPRLEPGYLIDLIGIRHDGYLEALIPATSQPAYRADHVPAPPLINGHVPGSISGAAMWHEPHGEPDGLSGTAYPAVDPQHGSIAAAASATAAAALAGGRAPDSRAPGGRAAGTGCVSLPYLSVGSLLRVRNDCNGTALVLPVIGPADTARRFCDRSVTCGPSPRGRIADLTLASFVELGGELDEGSFNVTLEIGV